MSRVVSLSALAADAKKRMNKGYGAKGDIGNFSKPARIFSFDRSAISLSKETDCYKIFEVLASDSDESPIVRLMDREYFDKLSPEQRQRYVFRLSEAYKTVKAQLKNNRTF